MTKIAAENIEEHIRRQTERILDASAELFTQNGYRATDLGKIATSAGLARNSLYRYFASKDHILVGVLQREMAQFIDQTAALAETYPDPAERIDAWLDLQMELAMGPCHAMIRMLGDMNDASDDLRQEIRSLHVPPRKALETAVSELLADRGTHRIGDLHQAKSGHIFIHDVTQLEISSTEIRELVAVGRDPRFLMPDTVRDVIEKSGCYAAPEHKET